MKNKLCQMPLLLAALFGLLSCTAIGKTADEFEEGKYEVIDTGLEQSTLYGPGVLGAWLDSRRIVINALQDVPNARKDWLLRLVIFDVKTRESKQIAESMHLNCRDPETQTASISERRNNVRPFVDKEFQFVKMDEEGKMTPLSEPPALMGRFCFQNSPRKPERLQAFLKAGDGYIDYGKTGAGDSKENAILYRQNQPPIELPVNGGSINHALYIPHLKQYLLGDTDYLSGRVQPLQKPVFNLMTSEGKVTEIPQPTEFVKKIGGFDSVRFMRDGMVLIRTGQGIDNPGLFFLKEGRAIRIFGADKQFASRYLSSPDGCTLAFLSFRNSHFVTKKTVKLINLCEEK